MVDVSAILPVLAAGVSLFQQSLLPLLAVNAGVSRCMPVYDCALRLRHVTMIITCITAHHYTSSLHITTHHYTSLASLASLASLHSSNGTCTALHVRHGTAEIEFAA
jgi:hypothetical protein